MKPLSYYPFLLLAFIAVSCRSSRSTPSKPAVLYQTPTLVITQLAPHTYLHTSYKNTNDFGKVACNGIIVQQDREAIVFDTPTNDSSAAELINWINTSLGCRIDAVVPTHFHDDCLGGLRAFHRLGILSYANKKTIELASDNHLEPPQHGFTDSLALPLSDQQVVVRFFGEGHTRDNVVGYFAADQVLFGGCLIKELKASKGYLGDANIDDWSATVQKVKAAYPSVKVVVPGHGKPGSIKLLDYTIQLFQHP